MGSSLTKKELGRIVDGLSLISKEVVKRSRSQNGDLQSLITSSLKKAILVVTDLSGLTTGEVREFSTPPPPPSPPTSSSNNSKATTSVVYFEAAVEENQPQTPSPLQPSPSPSPSNVGGKEVPFPEIPPPLPSNVGCDVKDGLLASEANVDLDKEEPAPSPPPPKIQKRRPRERRVPSTPFSRALGKTPCRGLCTLGISWALIRTSSANQKKKKKRERKRYTSMSI
ncbi:protein ABC transporter 1, mitochondrial-like [Camellia sinensis]|uniref:protein ABC transporter 1, mitochondrial-like n=1 Tax=Camellia sinensis TaxID=4442 RepID=UPI001036EE57|nr:protein ABC transporter 1, mitochondrial-like [Camellia sinensis]